MDKIELLGGACFSHGPYTFYKAVRIGSGRVLRLGNFFLTKLWNDADLVSIGELQLLWLDSRGPNQPLASLRLYFLPENTPDGRRDTHGEDEVLTISEKVVVRVNDLVTWLSPSLEWSWGREVSSPPSSGLSPNNSPVKDEGTPAPLPQVLTDPGIDFSDVEKQQKEYESNLNSSKKCDAEETAQTRVVVLSYPRYCRYRALLRRLEGAEPSWLCSPVAAALGGFTALPGTRVLFCRDTFDYPDLETHELLCNHLAPKLKGRPRRKRKKRSTSPGESSNESEASVASTSKTISDSIVVPGLRPPSSGVRRSERKTSTEEKRFISDVQTFMNSRGTPVGKMPLLGYKQIDLFLFYTKVQNMGGYESVSASRLWKSIYDEIGGNTGSTSAATITRRHYERLLLPFERHQRGEEIKIRPAHGRRSKPNSMSEEIEIKQESGIPSPSQTPPTFNTANSPTSTTVTPPLQSILSTPFLPGEKPKSEIGKISSLRSVRVKPERLKSLNTIIANPPTPCNQSIQLPSPPPSTNSPATTPTSTPSTTPNDGQSVLERQLNSPLMSHQQSSPSSTPPVNTTNTTNSQASAVVTLTPPPEKDIKEMKLDPKQNCTLLAQGKENIPIFGEKTIIAPPRSPEVIDLETETETSRDKIVIPSFKKRKLEILREGGLEVTAVDLETARPSVIQATITPVVIPSPNAGKHNEENCVNGISDSSTVLGGSNTKLISVTVTPDISHMLPSPQDNQNQNSQGSRGGMNQQQVVNQMKNHQPTNNNTSMNNNNVVNSRVINLGSSNNTTLLQLYSAAVLPSSNCSSRNYIPQQPNGRIPPPKVTQSRSIFSHNSRTVYGNPKDIMMPQKFTVSEIQTQRNSNCAVVNHSSGVLDLTQKPDDKPPTAFNSRPSLEIVRVPIVPRPNPLNLEMKNKEKQVAEVPKMNQGFNYPANMIDTRTMVSNNLEITLVNPSSKQKSSTQNQQQQILSPLVHTPRNNNISVGHQQQQRRHQQNQQQHNVVNGGKYPVRNETTSSYATRKTNHVVIPNIPNIANVPSLNHLNNIANSPYARSMTVDRRKSEVTSNKEQHRRSSESERCGIAAPQQQQQQQQQEISERQGVEAQQRHGAANVPSNYHPGSLPPLPPPNPAFLSQLNSHGKFIPMLDPMYYSAFYNGMFPPPIPPSASFIPPEVSAYYKELLATQPARLAMAGQPTVPTSK